MPRFLNIFSGDLYFDALTIEIFYRKEGFSLCNTAILKLCSLISYCKRLYKIPLFTILLLFYLFCILRYEKLVASECMFYL